MTRHQFATLACLLHENKDLLSTMPAENFTRQSTGPLSLAVKAAFDETRRDLMIVEERIQSRLGSDALLLRDISEYLLSLGGKRIRPVLTLLAARLFGLNPPSPALIDVAAGIELIHMATLLHDDIIDQSPLRRKQPSAFRKYGLTPSLLTGDFLLVRAFGLCAHLDDFVVNATESACVELTEGEILEGTLDLVRQVPLEQYINIIRKKTSALFALSAGLGAYIAKAPQSVVEQMRLFGDNAGIAFQMVDDILDITADEDLLGKPAGTDLRQKTPSLVNILWLESGDPRAKEYFSIPNPSESEAKASVEYLKSSNVISQAREIAKSYASCANAALLETAGPESDARVRNHLFAIVEYTLERCL